MLKKTNSNKLVLAPNGKRKKEIVITAHYSKTSDTIVKIISQKMAKDWLFNF